MRLVILFNGHGQSSRTNTGLGKLRKQIKQADDETEAWLFAWRHDTPTLAAWIQKTRAFWPVYVIGYSYGAQTGVLLCRELQRRGIKVKHLFLIDAIARPRPRIGSLRSLLDWFCICIPQNVRRVTSWRQRVSKPSGHRIFTDMVHTAHVANTLNVPHAQADDQKEVHDEILASLRD